MHDTKLDCGCSTIDIFAGGPKVDPTPMFSFRPSISHGLEEGCQFPCQTGNAQLWNWSISMQLPLQDWL